MPLLQIERYRKTKREGVSRVPVPVAMYFADVNYFYAAEAYLAKAVHEAEEGSSQANVDLFLKKSLENSKKALDSVGGGAK
ncbi:MAG: hypothetical protein H6Q84_562 [Deltaproteobacteria bacterium]|nr:hypothetical protein [Deltaproteobacteria bacterium]